MIITKTIEGEKLTVALDGRLDTITAPELEEALSNLDGVKELTMDLADLEYLSSAGLRVVLAVFRKIKAAGGIMKIVNSSEMVSKVFELTGFDKLFAIE